MDDNKSEKADEDMIFDVMLFFYQVESMLKNHSSMLSDKVSEGELIPSSIVFNNALIIANMKKILSEHPTLLNYSSSPDFQKRLESKLMAFQAETKTKTENLN